MSNFQCPECRRRNELGIRARLEIQSDSRSDEISIQLLTCRACGFCGIGVYEESRRGALDHESWSHSGYRLADSDFRMLQRDLAACPEPDNPYCSCKTHRRYGAKNSQGRWSGIDGLALGERFEITMI